MPTTTLTLHEVAAELNVHYMTVYRSVRMGRLRAHRDGGEWRVTRADLGEFLAERERARMQDAAVPRAKHGGRAKARWAERLEARLVAGDESAAQGVIDDALASGHDLFSLYAEVVSPAMRSIGERWSRGELAIHEEHRASNIVARLMGRTSPRFAHRGTSRGTIVIGAPAGEHHSLMITMVADLLRCGGFVVSDIGADVPAESFARAVTGVDDLVAVCVGVTVADALDNARASIAAVRGVTNAPCFVGGAAVVSDELAAELGADARIDDVRALIERLRRRAK